MRFAITAIDLYQDVFEALLEKGWEPVKLFTWPFPHPTPYADNRSVIARAEKLRIPIQLSRMDAQDMHDLARRGCDILVGAGYNWRIGDWRPHLPYAINFHPSPLPEGRGRYPMVRAILEGRTEWGVTCHRFDHDFDTGDVLAQDVFALAPDECHESLIMKVQIAGGRLARRVADDFHALWNGAAPQGTGSYWDMFGERDRTLDFSMSVERILRRIAAFGLLETIARGSDGRALLVRRATGWHEAHEYEPGAVVHRNNRHIVIAAADGYIGLIEWRHC
jgi:methionyl-tRNA formyltransferase